MTANDLTRALRSMRRSPLSTLVIVSTLALGIGAATAVFSVADAVLLRGLPYSEPDRIVRISELTTSPDGSAGDLSWPDYLDVKSTRNIFSAVAGYGFSGGVRIDTAAGPLRIDAAVVTSEFFDVLGVFPVAGRTFRPEEMQPGAPRVAMISNRLWKERYNGSADAIGTALRVENRPMEIVGVLPDGFHFAPAGSPDLWICMVPSRTQRERRYMHWIRPIARLAPGVTAERARAALQPVFERFHPTSNVKSTASVVAIRTVIVGTMRTIVFALFGAALAVFLIACANVANLLVARATDREVEIAIRAALGGSRGRIVRQFLSESLLLGAFGSIAGLALAGGVTSALIRLIPSGVRASLPFLDRVGVNAAVLLFAVAAALVATAFFGFVSAHQAYRSADRHGLRQGARVAGRMGGLRSLLVALEIALCLALAIASGLLFRSMSAIMSVDPGFARDHLLTLTVELPRDAYDTPQRAELFYERALEQIDRLPGVASAALVDRLPLTGFGNTGTPELVGEPQLDDHVDANLRAVSARYFETMGIALLRGRRFTSDDAAGRPVVAIVSQSLAGRLLRGGDVVGKRVRFTFMQEPVTIVGVAGDENVGSLDAEPRPVMYFHWPQEPEPLTSMVVRTSGSPDVIAATVAGSIRTLEPRALVHSVQSMRRLIADSPALFLRRFPLALIATFAAIALLLATIGIYGIVAWSVTRRTREFGIRTAIGATGSSILALILRQTMRIALIGIAAGLAFMIPAARFLSSLLFGIRGFDPLTWTTATVALLVACIAAALVPAMRAMRTNPAEALRDS